MKKTILLLGLIVLIAFETTYAAIKIVNEPDSVYLFSYATQKNSGLYFAWSTDQKTWSAIGPEFRFLFCDYGRWGAEKKMYNPFLFKSSDELWHCIWSVNNTDGVFAHAASKDLINWQRQSYPVAISGQNCTLPEVTFDKKNDRYLISWLSKSETETEAFHVGTKDFKIYSSAEKIPIESRLNIQENIRVEGHFETGIIQKISWTFLEGLIKHQQLEAAENLKINETAKDDTDRLSSLKSVEASLKVDMSKEKKISDLLMGIFFEDINYAADGGLYAELIQNRGFEYALSDKEGHDKNWNKYTAWSLMGSEGTFSIDTLSPIHPNNKHYAVLNIIGIGTGLVNEGFDSISITSGDKYDFSIFARNQDNKNKKLAIRLMGKNGEIYGETFLNTNSTEWKKFSAVLVAKKTASDAQLVIIPQRVGTVSLDMISLFPQKTFNARKNGLRQDLAQAIADIHPRFVRFPGGCVAHGDGIDNIYRWKNTVGPVETRKPQRNIWGYHQSMGLGYFEYFQFCEDIDAIPLPVLAAGVPCQNSATGGAGQQGGIPMCDMDNYIQDILDLVEWANGDVKTKWGKMRAEAGHLKPFNLKYIGIGNEDLITDVFEERFTMIFNAIKKKYPEIIVIGTVGPNSQGTDYNEGWDLATKLKVPMVDEHYYKLPGWFIHNQDFYDSYDRSKSKVYLGEYASRGNSLYNALSEALYLTALERNGDIVSMASYAPLLAKEGHTQWNPDLIYFNNTEVKPTVNYYVQQLCGQNAGDVYIENSIELSENEEAVRKRVAVSVVRNSKTGDLIIKLANLLPVAVNTQVNMEGIGAINPLATQTILTGKPSDKIAIPVTSSISVSNDFNCSLPAYSFTIICIKNN